MSRCGWGRRTPLLDVWYDSQMPHELDSNILAAGESAVRYAQQVRSFHRRRTERDSMQRRHDLMAATDRIAEAMKPIRSLIGKFPHWEASPANVARMESIREMSVRLQAERRKLWKMKQATKHRVVTVDDLRVPDVIE
jgi:hypothetical protein